MQGDAKVNKSSHCARQIHYHIVFPVKYRKALLDEEVQQIIEKTAREISERYDMEFEQIGSDKDHIHLLCTAHPKVAPGQIVQVFKSITAREIFRHKPSVKKQLWEGEFWTDGYYVATVGEGGQMECGGAVCARPRQAKRGFAAVQALLIPRALGAGIFNLIK